MRLNQKTALITGGGTGIGKATAELFSREGARVAILGRRRQPLEMVANNIHRRGGEAIALPGDVRKASDCGRAVKKTLEKFGTIDILVNNAGVFSETDPRKTSEKDWDKIIGINLKGSYLMTQQSITVMLKRGKGSIVNISSILGLIAMPGTFVYNASKGGMIALTRSIAIDYAREGIRCNCVCPGGVETPMLEKELKSPEGRKFLNEMHPMGRMGQPLDVAYAILYFASDESSWVTGAILPVDGGYTAH